MKLEVHFESAAIDEDFGPWCVIDATERSLGLFPTAKQAANALPDPGGRGMSELRFHPFADYPPSSLGRRS